MTPVSLMPPVDYCPSCEGQKAERNAIDIARNEVRQADLKADKQAAMEAPQPGAAPAQEQTAPVGGAVAPLISPDLAVQAMLAKPETGAANTQDDSGEAAAVRLRAAEAYRGV
jgi:hypothetical protein